MSFGDRSNLRRLEAAASATILLAGRQQTNLYPQSRENRDYSDFFCDASDFQGADTPRGFLWWIGRTIVVVFKLLCLLSLSAVSYGIFYKNFMPRQHALKNLYFDYSSRHGLAEDSQLSPRQPLPKQEFSSLPWRTHERDASVLAMSRPVPTATVNLLAKHNEWHAYFEDVLPPPLSQQRLLRAKQAYFIEVELELPESQANINAGMFGVITELYSSVLTCAQEGANYENRSLLAESRRSYRFPHQSPWISTVGKILLLLPLLIGAVQETRTVTSPAFRHYVESSERPLQYMNVKILEHDANARVEVVGGRIKIGEELSASQELLKDHFYTCYVLGTLIFCVGYYVLLVLLGLVWEGIKEVRQRRANLQEPPCELDLDTDDGFDDFEFDEIPRGETETTSAREDDVGANEAVTSDERDAVVGNEAEHTDDGDDWTDEGPVAGDGAEPIGGEERASNHAETENDPASHSRRIHVDDDNDDDDDEWEDLYYPADILPADVSSAVPLPHNSINRRSNDSDQRSIPHHFQREMTDEELSELILTGCQQSIGASGASTISPADRRRTTGNGSTGDSDVTRRHPFFFFFCW